MRPRGGENVPSLDPSIENKLMVNERICSTTKGDVTSLKKGPPVSRYTGGQGLKLPFKDTI